MKSEKNYDCIAKDFFAGKIARNRFIGFLASEIYRYPNRFGLLKFDEDFRSDVIVLFLERAQKMFARYKKDLGSFSGFLYTFVQGLILTQKRTFAEKELMSKALTAIKIPQLEMQRYFLQENSEMFESKTVCASLANEKTIKINCKAPKQLWSRIPNKNKDLYAITPKTALILALKSSYYLKSDAIEKVSSYCKLEKAELDRIVARLNEKLYGKIQKHMLLEKRRDSAYFFRIKHFLEMEYYEAKQKEYSVETAKRKYEVQNAHWKGKNKALHENACRISATNKQIASALGISERQVSYYIEHAKDIAKGLYGSKHPFT